MQTSAEESSHTCLACSHQISCFQPAVLQLERGLSWLPCGGQSDHSVMRGREGKISKNDSKQKFYALLIILKTVNLRWNLQSLCGCQHQLPGVFWHHEFSLSLQHIATGVQGLCWICWRIQIPQGCWSFVPSQSFFSLQERFWKFQSLQQELDSELVNACLYTRAHDQALPGKHTKLHLRNKPAITFCLELGRTSNYEKHTNHCLNSVAIAPHAPAI